MTVELLKFEADWCAPCKQQSQILEDFNAVPVREIDVEENQELANEYNVRSLPTMILQNNGEFLERFVGVTEISRIQEAVDMYGDLS